MAEPRQQSGPLVGGKAESWRLMATAGIAVPDGFALAADVPVEAERLERDLRELRARTGTTTVAVRSSGVGEDGTSQALAGLFESFLDVPATTPDVLAAVKRCRALGASARAMAAAGRAVPMGVLVQVMVHPTCSGVVFTQDPLGQTRGMVVEAVQGHLGRLVDGRGDAVRWVLDRAHEVPAGFADIDGDHLEDLGRQVEGIIGEPADIEWALADGHLVVLQARPITCLVVPGGAGLDLVPVSVANAARLPPAVVQHDKIALRLAASELGIGISQGFVALASSPNPNDVARAAKAIAGWGEFIAVLLVPFDLEGDIFRKFGSGPTAPSDLQRFVDTVGAKHDRFALLLKELQETASTGVALQLPDESIHVELVHGHFVTKGFADPAVYVLDLDGQVTSHTPGRQEFAMQLVGGKTTRVPVDQPIEATAKQLAAIKQAAVGLAARYPGAGIEFGFTPEPEFFLVDLYQSTAAAPPDQGDVLSHGRVVGRVRLLELPETAIEDSIERHIHSRRTAAAVREQTEIIVVRRPLHVFDHLVYEASPGTLGFIVEGGALLCHLAVVMREHGVPGLILADATSSFTEGDLLVLDTRPGSIAAVTRL